MAPASSQATLNAHVLCADRFATLARALPPNARPPLKQPRCPWATEEHTTDPRCSSARRLSH
eukprot:7345724-Alexandrium_andersonii.AAC.1